MAHFNFSQPRKKRRVNIKREAPFPVPIATITGKPASNQNWFYYTGELQGDHVIVYHSGDIYFLYTMGFFGKGNLSSRGKPDFNQQGMTVKLSDATSYREESLKVMERRRYLLHQEWATGEKSEYGEYGDETEDDASKDIVCSSILLTETKQLEQTHCVTSMTTESGDVSGDETADKEQTVTSIVEDGSTNWEMLESEWDAQTGDQDFWADGGDMDRKLGDVNETAQTGRYSSAGYGDFWGSETPGSVVKGDDPALHDMDVVTPPSTPECQEHRMTCDKPGLSLETKNNEFDIDIHSTPTDVVKIVDKSESVTNRIERTRVNTDMSIVNISRSSADVQNLSDDAEGKNFVIDDTNSRKKFRKSKHRFLPVRRKDPYPLDEFLLLTLEEAFFLSYGLGCLILLDETKRTLRLTDMWKRFCATKIQFLPHYIAYHYFRSKGWVPKTGIKFGVDFILYKEGPPFYHGSYSTIVKFVEEETLAEIPKYISRKLTWTSLSGINRLTEQVGKELLFCYVIKPKDLSQEDMLSPRCISQFKVQEVHLSRWVSGQEREKTLEEMP